MSDSKRLYMMEELNLLQCFDRCVCLQIDSVGVQVAS